MKKVLFLLFAFFAFFAVNLSLSAAPRVCCTSLDPTNHLLTISWCGIDPNSQYEIQWSDDPAGLAHPLAIPSTIAGPWQYDGPLQSLVETLTEDNYLAVTIIIAANQPHEFFRLAEFDPPPPPY